MEKISNLSLACVRYTDGTINEDATLEAFKTQVIALVDVEELLGGRIEKALQATFDQYRGQTLTMPSLVNVALVRLNVTPDTFAAYSAAVAEYVRNRPETYKISKGKGGGVSRIADAVAK
jgi:hypothetical protein